ncbi:MULTISPECIES: AI-2E family transporter [Muribaculaceae]|uniref:AI-2E family transporter n=1 Tax=Muribaculaceae TaxID=2005473 RepID=UPI002627577E|nr:MULTISPECIES: AI-2E family transporter [Muribaculaceae]
MEQRQPYTFDRVVRILFSVCGILVVIYLLDVLKGVLLPFLVACLICYILEPVVKWNMRWMHLRSRFLPVVATLLEAAAVLMLFCWFFIPYIVKECQQMTEVVRAYASEQIHLPYISESIHRFILENVDFNRLARMLSREEWIALIRNTVASSWNFLTSGVAFIASIVSWMVVILYVLFIMLDYERLMLSFRQLVPHNHRRRVYRITSDIKHTMSRYFRGQFLIAAIVGILFALGFMMIGLPMGVVLGLFIGVLNLVPYLQLISLPITALLCLVWTAGTGGDFWVIFWESMAVYVVVQCIQDLVLTPRVMGKAMGLNPAIILLALSVWGSLLGFMGLIIALPLTTLILSYYNQYVVERSQQW